MNKSAKNYSALERDPVITGLVFPRSERSNSELSEHRADKDGIADKGLFDSAGTNQSNLDTSALLVQLHVVHSRTLSALAPHWGVLLDGGRS